MKKYYGRPMRFYPEILNFMSAEERQEHKDKVMRESIQYMYKNSPEFYQVRFKVLNLVMLRQLMICAKFPF